MISVAVLGYGTVGSGVVEVIEGNNALIAQRIHKNIHVKYILDLRDFPGDPFEEKIVHDVNIILDDPEISVVCEVMGGVGAAYQFSKSALERGKSVCTSNKELVAAHGTELLQIAKEHGCYYLFEASVGGGIPLIRPLVRSLAAEKIESIVGILNGTTNYILTKMDREGAQLETVLKEAQELGYAERNPEADVQGHDACRKICILSNLMTGHFVDSAEVPTEGIMNISAEDFALANVAGYTIRLLGVSRVEEGGRLSVYVAPHLVPQDHILAGVSDVFNGIMVTGNMVGDTMYYGKGAGKLPTASAVVSDVIDAVLSEGSEIPGGWDSEKVELWPLSETKSNFLLRVDKSLLGEMEKAFPDGSIITVSGMEQQAGYLTGCVKTGDLEQALDGWKENVHGVLRILA
ncbi:MAG: homoserine dehydrogenase [Lachnospiraceae bacterium]|nr:homoserine dehydrogenase [Lachnospiraceae bacterium]